METNTINQQQVSAVEAIKRLFSKNKEARISRSQFWWGFLFIMIASYVLEIILAFIMNLIYGEDAQAFNNIIGNFINLLVIYISIKDLWVPRMHDIGKSGLFCLIPFYNLFLAAQPSEPQENKFGAVPNVK